jgi:EAL and modified HD-GYP domain-containing signal transduction protein
MAEIMKELPLADRIKAALTDGSNDLGLFLSLSKHYEKGEWQSVCRICSELGIQECRIPPIYTEACQWADSLAG